MSTISNAACPGSISTSRLRCSTGLPLFRRYRRKPLDLDRFGPLLGLPEIVLHLQAQPGFGTAPESLSQPDCHFRRQAGMAVQQLGQCLARDAQAGRRGSNREPERFKAFLSDDLSGMGRVAHSRHFPFRLVIVHEVNVGRIFAGEFETQPEASRYGDRPLATSAATQGMEPQARERHVTGRFAGIQKGKDTPQPRYMLGRHPAGVPDRNRRSKPLWRKRLIMLVTYNVTSDADQGSTELSSRSRASASGRRRARRAAQAAWPAGSAIRSWRISIS